MTATQSSTRRQRVPALSPQQRRAALIEATIPLLRRHGTEVSTRQIADAAGVAEGTIFGVFKDKASLLRAAVIAALDPQPLLHNLRAIDLNLPLRARLVTAVRLIREHVAGQATLCYVVSGPLFADDRSSLVEVMSARYLIVTGLTHLIDHDARLLRHSPVTAARLLLALAGSPPGAFGGPDEALSDEEIVSLILDGLLIHPPPVEGPAGSVSSTVETPC